MKGMAMGRTFGFFLLLLGAQGAPSPFRAGFAEVDITPPIGIARQGWNSVIYAEKVLDPLFARAAVFEANGSRVAFVQLDIAAVNPLDAAEIRRRVEKDHGLPGDRVMVCSTHNHAGPVVTAEALPRDEKWIETMNAGAAAAVGRAIAALQEAEFGLGVAFEWEVAFNRRVVMRDGTVRTHGSFKDPNAMAFEGPIDPEVGVAAARGKDGKILGAVVNFACHPTHHGGDPLLSAGYPGVIARVLKEKGVPVTLFLQGAAGNMSHGDPRGNPEKKMDEVGERLGADALRALEKAKWSKPSRVLARSKTLDLEFRKPTEEDVKGTARGTQRFGEKGYYDRKIPELMEWMKKKGTEQGEVQVFRLDDVAFASQPSESFAELGLRIKERTWPVRTFVVCYANGHVGYIPHLEAFARGGYECTFGPPSYMAPGTGEKLADAAIELIRP
jgi:hypothetical protein